MPDVCLFFVLLFTFFIIVVTQKLVLQRSKNVTAKCTENLSPPPCILYSLVIVYLYSITNFCETCLIRIKKIYPLDTTKYTVHSTQYTYRINWDYCPVSLFQLVIACHGWPVITFKVFGLFKGFTRISNQYGDKNITKLNQEKMEAYGLSHIFKLFTYIRSEFFQLIL